MIIQECCSSYCWRKKWSSKAFKETNGVKTKNESRKRLKAVYFDSGGQLISMDLEASMLQCNEIAGWANRSLLEITQVLMSDSKLLISTHLDWNCEELGFRSTRLANKTWLKFEKNLKERKRKRRIKKCQKIRETQRKVFDTINH